MPKIIKDESGADIEVYDKSEFETAQKAAADAKAKELEQDIHPDWPVVRARIKEAERKEKELRERLSAAGVKDDEHRSMSEDEVAKIADRQYLERYKLRVLSAYGDKRDKVEAYFSKLSQGEQLDESAIDRIAEDAARAAGVQNPRTVTPAQAFARSGSRPEFVQAKDDDGFGATEAGRSTAAAMGLRIDSPNKK